MFMFSYIFFAFSIEFVYPGFGYILYFKQEVNVDIIFHKILDIMLLYFG
jgi:hypothetical protein